MSDKLTRRQFLRLGATAAAALALGKLASETAPEQPEVKADAAYEPFEGLDTLITTGFTVTDADEGLPWVCKGTALPPDDPLFHPNCRCVPCGVFELSNGTIIKSVDGGLTWITLTPMGEG